MGQSQQKQQRTVGRASTPRAGRQQAPGARRLRFGDMVELRGARYTVVAFRVAPDLGVWVRPLGAEDAEADQLLALACFATLAWDGERWAAA